MDFSQPIPQTKDVSKDRYQLYTAIRELLVTHHCQIFGGALRDEIAGRIPNDFDVKFHTSDKFDATVKSLTEYLIEDGYAVTVGQIPDYLQFVHDPNEDTLFKVYEELFDLPGLHEAMMSCANERSRFLDRHLMEKRLLSEDVLRKYPNLFGTPADQANFYQELQELEEWADREIETRLRPILQEFGVPSSADRAFWGSFPEMYKKIFETPGTKWWKQLCLYGANLNLHQKFYKLHSRINGVDCAVGCQLRKKKEELFEAHPQVFAYMNFDRTGVENPLSLTDISPIKRTYRMTVSLREEEFWVDFSEFSLSLQSDSRLHPSFEAILQRNPELIDFDVNSLYLKFSRDEVHLRSFLPVKTVEEILADIAAHQCEPMLEWLPAYRKEKMLAKGWTLLS